MQLTLVRRTCGRVAQVSESHKRSHKGSLAFEKVSLAVAKVSVTLEKVVRLTHMCDSLCLSLTTDPHFGQLEALQTRVSRCETHFVRLTQK